MYGINTDKTKAFFIPPQKQVGAWLLEPLNNNTAKKIILYLHGIKGTRGRSHRVNLYNVLLEQGFKILTIDYRGFGDSAKTSVDETTAVQDAKTALDWLREKYDENFKIFVWGHSMGTGVASRAVAEEFLDKDNNTRLDGLILEAPFNKLTDEVKTYIAPKKDSSVMKKILFSPLSLLNKTSLPSYLMSLINMEFNSEEWVPKIKCPVMILHAKKDEVILFALAEKLFNTVKDNGKRDIEIHAFDGDFGHNNIHKSNNLPTLVNNFTENLK